MKSLKKATIVTNKKDTQHTNAERNILGTLSFISNSSKDYNCTGGVTITPHMWVPITPITRKFWENTEKVSKIFEKWAKSWKKSEKVDFNEGKECAIFLYNIRRSLIREPNE